VSAAAGPLASTAKKPAITPAATPAATPATTPATTPARSTPRYAPPNTPNAAPRWDGRRVVPNPSRSAPEHLICLIPTRFPQLVSNLSPTCTPPRPSVAAQDNARNEPGVRAALGGQEGPTRDMVDAFRTGTSPKRHPKCCRGTLFHREWPTFNTRARCALIGHG